MNVLRKQYDSLSDYNQTLDCEGHASLWRKLSASDINLVGKVSPIRAASPLPRGQATTFTLSMQSVALVRHP